MTPTEIADQLFDTHAEVFGDDLPAYRGHVMRIIEMTMLQVGALDPPMQRVLGVAGFYHDAGIWFDDTWDYLDPSIDRAIEELGGAHADDVAAIIGEHHRLRTARHRAPVVDAFRRADMADVLHPLRAPGVGAERYRALVRAYPYHGFRRMLVRAFVRGVRADPLRPLPMLRW